MNKYVHGYSDFEANRLRDQAKTLDELLHHDSVFSEKSKVLEAGCGVGSQTRIIAPKNPTCEFTSIDLSEKSINNAKETIKSLGISNVLFKVDDIMNLSFLPETFDHVFVCFVLEHLSNPVQALLNLKQLIKPGGSITIIEGDHGSTFFHPNSIYAHKAIECQVELQKRHGGNASIGREIYPLLAKAGFSSINVSPRMVYVDSGKPELVEGFIKNTFTAMIKGVEKEALENSLITKEDFKKGIEDLYRTTQNDGVFCYTFFKGIAIKD